MGTSLPVLLYWSAKELFTEPLLNPEQVAAQISDTGPIALLDSGSNAAAKRLTVVAVNLQTQPLEFAAVHRVVHGLEYFQPGWMVNFARENFLFRDIGLEVPQPRDLSDANVYADCLKPGSTAESSFLAVTRLSTWRFHARHAWMDGFLPGIDPALRRLGAVQLHKLVLPRGLYPPEGVKLDDHIRYTVSTPEAVAAVAAGANVAFLMNPHTATELREVVQRAATSPEFAIQMQEMLPVNSFAVQVPELGVPSDGA